MAAEIEELPPEAVTSCSAASSVAERFCVISDGIRAAAVPGFQPGKVSFYHVIDLGLVELACRVDADPSMTDIGRPEWQVDEPVRADSACHGGDAYRYDGDGFLAFVVRMILPYNSFPKAYSGNVIRGMDTKTNKNALQRILRWNASNRGE